MLKKHYQRIKIITFFALSVSLGCTEITFAESRQYINDHVQKIIDDVRLKYDIPGIEVSISFPGEDLPHDFVSGTTTLNGNIPIKPDNLFQIGSETKSFTATLLLQLEAEGILSLNDKIGKWLPEIIPLWKNITIRQLLNHTSGIFNYVEVEEFWDAVYKNLNKVWTNEELINFTINKPLYFLPGEGWHYSNTNYVLAGIIVYAATGNSIEHEIKTRLINPTHLSNTYYISGEYSKEIVNLMPHSYSRTKRFSDEPKDVTDSNMSWGNAAGAMISTSHDVAIWFRKLANGSLLPTKQQIELTSFVDMKTGQPLPISSKNSGYGLGVTRKFNSVAGEIWTHMGGTLGYVSNMIWIKCNDVVISININNVQIDTIDINALSNDLVSFIIKLDISKQCQVNKSN